MRWPKCSEIPTKRPFISVDSEQMVSSYQQNILASTMKVHHTSKDFKGHRLMSVVESRMIEYKCIVMPVAIYKLGTKWP